MPNQASPPDTSVSSTLGTEPGLRPTNPADLVQALAFALRHRGRKRVDTAGEAMARITAERLVEHLAQSGFVVMQKPARPDGPDWHYGGFD